MIKSTELLAESIAHWERMLKWARQQKPLYKADSLEMKESLGESWDGSDCPLCKNYRFCKGCPLFEQQGDVCDGFNNTAWSKIHKSRNWSEWVINAVRMIETLKNVLDIEKQKEEDLDNYQTPEYH